MFNSCEIRVHPTGSVIARLGMISQGYATQDRAPLWVMLTISNSPSLIDRLQFCA
jgi:hypothetical protein